MCLSRHQRQFQELPYSSKRVDDLTMATWRRDCGQRHEKTRAAVPVDSDPGRVAPCASGPRRSAGPRGRRQAHRQQTSPIQTRKRAARPSAVPCVGLTSCCAAGRRGGDRWHDASGPSAPAKVRLGWLPQGWPFAHYCNILVSSLLLLTLRSTIPLSTLSRWLAQSVGDIGADRAICRAIDFP